MIHHCTLNLNALEALNFFWTSIASREKLTEKFILDIATLEPFLATYNEEFTQESVRRCLSALSNKEPFTGNKVENRFYSRNLMILEYIDTLNEKIAAFKSLRINDILHSFEDLKPIHDIDSLDIIVVPSPFETVQCSGNVIILNFFKFNLVDGELKADDLTLPEILKKALFNTK